MAVACERLDRDKADLLAKESNHHRARRYSGAMCHEARAWRNKCCRISLSKPMERVNHCSIAVNPARIWICACHLISQFPGHLCQNRRGWESFVCLTFQTRLEDQWRCSSPHVPWRSCWFATLHAVTFLSSSPSSLLDRT